MPSEVFWLFQNDLANRNMSMKILITGASGKIGLLARSAFAKEQVTLMSRKCCECGPNEKWIACSSLDDVDWWSNQALACDYDLVLHFAEPVKKCLKPSELLRVVDSHVAFIKNSLVKSRLVLYPQTALVYDRRLSKSEQAYLAIKRDVVERTVGPNNLLVPVIHPIINYGDGLATMRGFIQRIPIFNPFCDFKSTVPILYKNDLEKLFRSLCDQTVSARKDYYSCELCVSDIFHSDFKMNIYSLSLVLRRILCFFESIPKVYILLNGRRIS